METVDLVRECNRVARDKADVLSTKPVAVGTVVVVVSKTGKLTMKWYSASVKHGAVPCVDALGVFMEAGNKAFMEYMSSPEECYI